MDDQSITIEIQVSDDEFGDDITLRIEDYEKQSQSSTEDDQTQAHSSDAGEGMLLPQPNNSSDATSSRLSSYNKNEILKSLMANSCSASSTAAAMNRFKVDPEVFREYFNRQAGQAQRHVGEECGSFSFENINAWLSSLKKEGLHEYSDFETAHVMKSIADNEKHPRPSEIGGIDLKAVYKFLGDALLGLPQTELDPKSAAFLAAEFQDLINEVNSDLAQIQVTQIKATLREDINQQPGDIKLGKLSLDPLGIDKDIEKFL